MKTSGENYLETIYRLTEESEYVRSIDVARRTGYSKPSVSRALVRLKKEAVIDIDETGKILMTEQGRALVEKLLNRQVILKDFLIRFAEMPEAEAAVEADCMKHTVSDRTVDYMKHALSKKKKRFSGGIHQR